uniref:Uncharacterized protein n=1 Tax=Arundo donax TaxID=35708 RepID=A0A0A9H2T5_ARUDO
MMAPHYTGTCLLPPPAARSIGNAASTKSRQRIDRSPRSLLSYEFLSRDHRSLGPVELRCLLYIRLEGEREGGRSPDEREER